MQEWQHLKRKIKMGYASDIIDEVGETVTVTIKSQTTDDWGHETETTVTTGSTTASAQIMDGSEEEVKEGLMQTGDLTIFFKPNDTFVDYFDLNSYNVFVTYNSIEYRIYNIIQEPASIQSGHYELHGRRI